MEPTKNSNLIAKSATVNEHLGEEEKKQEAF